jgi:hypothetical protein
VPGENGYGCSFPVNPQAERDRGIVKTCNCTFAEGNPVTPEWVHHEPLKP